MKQTSRQWLHNSNTEASTSQIKIMLINNRHTVLDSWENWRISILKLRIFWRVLNWMQTDCPDDGGSTHLWNVGQHSIKNTAVHPNIFWASHSPPWELEI